jgi:hypothetical protein
MVPNDNSPQPGPDVSRLAAAAQRMLQARKKLYLLKASALRASNLLDLAKDDFTQELRAVGQDGFEALGFHEDNGEFWMIRVDDEDGSVISITPAMEIE